MAKKKNREFVVSWIESRCYSKVFSGPDMNAVRKDFINQWEHADMGLSASACLDDMWLDKTVEVQELSDPSR